MRTSELSLLMIILVACLGEGRSHCIDLTMPELWAANADIFTQKATEHLDREIQKLDPLFRNDYQINQPDDYETSLRQCKMIQASFVHMTKEKLDVMDAVDNRDKRESNATSDESTDDSDSSEDSESSDDSDSLDDESEIDDVEEYGTDAEELEKERLYEARIERERQRIADEMRESSTSTSSKGSSNEQDPLFNNNDQGSGEEEPSRGQERQASPSNTPDATTPSPTISTTEIPETLTTAEPELPSLAGRNEVINSQSRKKVFPDKFWMITRVSPQTSFLYLEEDGRPIELSLSNPETTWPRSVPGQCLYMERSTRTIGSTDCLTRLPSICEFEPSTKRWRAQLYANRYIVEDIEKMDMYQLRETMTNELEKYRNESWTGPNQVPEEVLLGSWLPEFDTLEDTMENLPILHDALMRLKRWWIDFHRSLGKYKVTVPASTDVNPPQPWTVCLDPRETDIRLAQEIEKQSESIFSPIHPVAMDMIKILQGLMTVATMCLSLSLLVLHLKLAREQRRRYERQSIGMTERSSSGKSSSRKSSSGSPQRIKKVVSTTPAKRPSALKRHVSFPGLDLLRRQEPERPITPSAPPIRALRDESDWRSEEFM